MLGVEVVDEGDAAGYGNVLKQKYGDDHYGGYSALLTRLQSYGFNTVGEDSSWFSLPVATYAGSGNPTKMPFIWQIHPSDGFKNPTYPFKDIVSTMSDSYPAYRADSLADFFDPNWTSYLNSTGSPSPWGRQLPFPSFADLDASPLLLGVTLDDGDRVWGFKAAQRPNSLPHAGWMVATTTPFQVYTGRWKFVYRDPNLYAKQELASWLQGTADGGPGYTSIGQLNAAWGSSYSTFGSAGLNVTGEPIATGDGSTTTFTHTLAHTVVDPWSVAIVINGQTLGGDCPWFDNVGFELHSDRDCATGLNNGGNLPSGEGTLGGTNITGIAGNIVYSSIDYKSGALSVVFSTPPPSGANITVNYIYGGWPHALTGGTGLLDEDGTNTWFPDARVSGLFTSATPPQIDLDLDNFLGHIAKQYFSTASSAVRAKLPHHLVFSQNFLGAYDRPVILQQAGKYLDAVMFEDVGDSTQLIRAHAIVNKPVLIEDRFIANPDSPFAAYPCDSADNPPFTCQPTQEARGQAYASQFATDFNLAGDDGLGFIVGLDYWQMTDKTSEHQNFGLWDPLDNSYDGTEDRMGLQPCNPEKTTNGYKCGGESAGHGDFLGAVRRANTSWLNSGQIQNMPSPTPATPLDSTGPQLPRTSTQTEVRP